MSPKITFLIPVYNESERIINVLQHAVLWADEVIVIDKSSTDNTRVVAEQFGDKISVHRVPYSKQGTDDEKAYSALASNDWIFVGTCSEIPTRKLIRKTKELLAKDGDILELIYVPRKAYSFGIHSVNIPWNIAYFPFLFNRNKIEFTGIIHEHFRPRDKAKTAIIAYEEDCHVYHLTHSSARRFIEAHAQYAEREAELAVDPSLSISNWFSRIHDALPKITKTGSDWPGLFAAWAICNLMNILFTWEKNRGVNVLDFYSKKSAQILENEWGVIPAVNPVIGILAESASPCNISLLNTSSSKIIKPFYISSICSVYEYFLKNPYKILISVTNKLLMTKQQTCNKMIFLIKKLSK